MDIDPRLKKAIEKVAYSAVGRTGVGLGTSTIPISNNSVTKSMKSPGAKNLTPARLTKPTKMTSTIRSPSQRVVTDAVKSTSKMQNANQNYGIKVAHVTGENMNETTIGKAYNQGILAALEKMAMPLPQGAMMDPAMQQQMMMAQQMPMEQMPQEAMQPPVGPQMQEVQEEMAAPAGQPGQPSPEELQAVQNSGVSSSDIAAAAKVIQTMAEMKATADMADIQPMDPNAQQMPGAAPAPAAPTA